MRRLRKLIPALAAFLVLFGLVYTLTLDTSTPVVVEEEEGAVTPAVQQVLDETPFHDIVYTVGDMGLHFALNDQGQWLWQDDVSFPLDDTWVAQLALDLEALSYLRSIPLTEDNPMHNYGLEEPWGSLTATRGDGTTLALMFGNLGDDGQTYYMFKDGDVETVFVYNNDWMDILDIPIYDMMVLPALPALSVDTITRVDASNAETTVFLIPTQNEDASTTWRLAGETDTLDLPLLMDAITSLELEKCFSYNPSEGACTICGFDTPTTISVFYTQDDQEEVATLSLHFGTISTDEAYRYVQLGDDTTMYLMAEETASVLLSLVEQGLT